MLCKCHEYTIEYNYLGIDLKHIISVKCRGWDWAHSTTSNCIYYLRVFVCWAFKEQRLTWENLGARPLRKPLKPHIMNSCLWSLQDRPWAPDSWAPGRRIQDWHPPVPSDTQLQPSLSGPLQQLLWTSSNENLRQRQPRKRIIKF